MRRLRNVSGIVLRRTVTPAGDIVVQLLTPGGKLGAIARGGMRSPAQQSRLNLFHDVAAQLYARERDDLATIRQVTLQGALPGLAQPGRYPYAHFLAELTDVLNPEGQSGERARAVHDLLAGGLRGVSRHDDPEWVAFAVAMKLLALAGFTQPPRCGRCGAEDPRYPDLARGQMLCARCALPGAKALSEAAARFLLGAQRHTVRELMEAPLHGDDRKRAWEYLRAYLVAQVGRVRSAAAVGASEVRST